LESQKVKGEWLSGRRKRTKELLKEVKGKKIRFVPLWKWLLKI
jgi:hypothetical protein